MKYDDINYGLKNLLRHLNAFSYYIEDVDKILNGEYDFILKTNLKTVIKQAKNTVGEDGKINVDAFKLAVKKIDQAANKGIIHKNCAARKKSQLAKMSH